jgi:extracellular elastinolytic metalloproteinase
VSAYTAAGNRFEALRDFQVFASNGGVLWVPVTSGSFPTEAPRPTAPQLRYKRIDLGKGVLATHLKLVASPQHADAERVQVAEFQAFTGSKVEIDTTGAPPDAAVHDEGLVVATTADGQLTLNLMTSGVCLNPPPTQGIDAWVTELPVSYADGLHLITVKPEPQIPSDPRPDVDVYFLSADCQSVGTIASTSGIESGTIPQGTRYVVSNLYTTAASRVIVDARPPQ